MSNKMFETDEEYKNRLLQSDKVSWYFAEDIGNAFGEELDNIGDILDIPRRKLTVRTNERKD